MLFREDIKIEYNLSEDTDLSGISLKEINKLNSAIEEIHKNYEKKMDELLHKEEFESLTSYVYDRTLSVTENISEVISDLNEELMFQKERLKDNPKSVKSWIYKENIEHLRKFVTKLQKLRRDVKVLKEEYSELLDLITIISSKVGVKA